MSSLLPACSHAPDGARMAAVDLMRKLPDAERRPTSATFELGESTFAGERRATIVAPAESRLTWRLFLPRRGTLQLYAAVPSSDGEGAVAFRIGISDNRRYHTLSEQTITSQESRTRGWIPLTADLSDYAGRKWSVFYHPDAIRWGVVIGTHVLSGTPGVVYIGAPAIITDIAGAREYATRVVHQEKNRQ